MKVAVLSVGARIVALQSVYNAKVGYSFGYDACTGRRFLDVSGAWYAYGQSPS